MRRSFRAALAIFAVICSLPGILGPIRAVAADGGFCSGGRMITLAGVNWDSGEFITAVTREILERGFGCRTEVIPGNSVTLEQAVANNDIQILAEEWVSRGDVWKQAAAKGQVRAIGHPFVDATEGWYVPDYLVTGDSARGLAPLAADLHDVAQLTEPRFVALFKDPEQPDRGRFLNCPSGWTCEGVNSAKLHAYGLDQLYVDFRPGTGPAMDAAITSAYLQGLPLLFYYWSPSSIAGKLKLMRLAEPAYSDACWQDLTSSQGRHRQGCTAPPADVAYGVSTPFAESAPDIIAMLSKATFPTPELNNNLSAMVGAHRSAKEQAEIFLRDQPEIWHPWLGGGMAARIEASLAGVDQRSLVSSFPQQWMISIRAPVNDVIANLVNNHGQSFRAIAHVTLSVIVLADRVLAKLPWWVVIALFMGLAWLSSRRAGLTVLVGALMMVIGVLGLWDLMLQTLTLMLFASLVVLITGLPIGILVAKSRVAKAVIIPILDIMQTMPSFVYLIPALMLFGLGKVPAILATVIYAWPPMIRLTALGIEQVDHEIEETGTAFGLTRLQMLLSVELPLALPTLMAGVNQTIMLALSMVVVASMIGARGLGEQVLNGIQTLDVGLGLEAGIGIVILAFILDRITQGFGTAKPGTGRENG